MTLVVTSQGTYAMGGREYGSNYRNEVLKFDCLGDQIQNCQWKNVGNLQFARAFHVAIALPESSDICRDTTPTTPSPPTITATATTIIHRMGLILILLLNINFLR